MMSISPRAYGYTALLDLLTHHCVCGTRAEQPRAEICEMLGFHTPETDVRRGASPAEQPLSVSVRGHSPARAATGEMRPTFVAVEADIDSPNRIISTCGFAVRTLAMYRQSSAQVVALRA